MDMTLGVCVVVLFCGKVCITSLTFKIAISPDLVGSLWEGVVGFCYGRGHLFLDGGPI